jgi:hypothetical protein
MERSLRQITPSFHWTEEVAMDVFGQVIAKALLKEQERICRELGDKHGLARSLIYQAVILVQKEKKGDAHRLAEESFNLT